MSGITRQKVEEYAGNLMNLYRTPEACLRMVEEFLRVTPSMFVGRIRLFHAAQALLRQQLGLDPLPHRGLSDEAISAIRGLRLTGMSIRETALETGHTRRTVRKYAPRHRSDDGPKTLEA